MKLVATTSILFTCFCSVFSPSYAAVAGSSSAAVFKRVEPGPERTITLKTEAYRSPDRQTLYISTDIIFGPTSQDHNMRVQLGISTYIGVSEKPGEWLPFYQRLGDTEDRELVLGPTRLTNLQLFNPSAATGTTEGRQPSIIADIWVFNARVFGKAERPPPGGDYPFQTSPHGTAFSMIKAIITAVRNVEGGSSPSAQAEELGKIRDYMAEETQLQLSRQEPDQIEPMNELRWSRQVSLAELERGQQNVHAEYYILPALHYAVVSRSY